MATQNVCRYFKFGFCKYLERCRFPHVKEVCESQECDGRSCTLRHPRICSYYRDYNRCKFGEWCCFKHVEKDRISVKEIANKVENLEKLIKEKDEIISILVNKMKLIEEKLCMDKKPVNVTEDSSDEKEVRKETVEKFKCDLCEYESNSKRGIHIHKKKKHEKIFECDLCHKTFETEVERRIHRKTHSFKSQFMGGVVCENCGFECKSIYNMEVHIGKCFSNNFECGLCDAKFEDLTSLELHLRTCEIYECSECYQKIKTITDMKKHFVDNHASCDKGSDVIQHLKIDLERLSEVIIKSYFISEL